MTQQGNTAPHEPSAESGDPLLSGRERFTVEDPSEVGQGACATRESWFAPVTEEEVAAAWRQNAADLERLRQEFADLQRLADPQEFARLKIWWWQKRRGARTSPASSSTLPAKN